MKVLGAVLAWAAAGGALAQAELDFAINFDPASGELHGRGVITAEADAKALVLNERFEMLRLRSDGAVLTATPKLEGNHLMWPLPKASETRRIEVEWRGTLPALEGEISHRDTLTRREPTAGPRGSFLPADGDWHPSIADAAATYRIALELPEGQKGLVPGRLLDEQLKDGRYRARFEFPYPAQGIDLMVGPYQVERREMRSWKGRPIEVRTYFHAELAGLSASYLDAVKRYIDLYENWIGDYPYSEFSVVSSPTPTGLGMPTLTYLGIDVLRLPFIRTTSLGHEVLHNWWGNGVRPDYPRGNWSEGLTTFMADYAYREREGEEPARTMRLEWLRDFTAVPAGTDRPLQEFTSRTHGTSQIVGYQKAAMMFFMLRDRIGKEAFDEAVRKFWRDYRQKTASWGDLQRAFAAAAGENLDLYFKQWLSRAGAPAVRLAGAEAIKQGDRQAIRIELAQSAPTWRVHVPIVIRTESGPVARAVDLSSERTAFVMDLEARPVSVTLDPEFRVFRRLLPEETPPILRQVMLDRTTALIAATPALAESATALAQKVVERPPRRHAAEAKPPATALIVVGSHDDVDAWLARFGGSPRPAVVGQRGTAQVWTGTMEGRGLIVISVRDANALNALARPLPHYGRASWLVFDEAKVLDRGVWPARPQELPVK